MENQNNSFKSLWLSIGSISVVIAAFLFWWIYGKETADGSGLAWVSAFLFLNSGLNTLTAILLCCGVAAIKNGKKELHRNIMITAGVVSALFLVSYLTYHHFSGDTKFVAQGVNKTDLFLYTHFTYYSKYRAAATYFGNLLFSIYKKWATHKKVAK